MSERIVEIPYMLRHIRENDNILDVGADRSGYTQALLSRNCIIDSCDPVRDDVTFKCKFEDIVTDKIYEKILFISSLEHFDASIENLYSTKTEIFAINKCRSLLSGYGNIIITVPFGREYKVNEDTILFSRERIEKIVKSCNINVVDEEIHKNIGIMDENFWAKSCYDDVANCYYNSGNNGYAQAVYCGVWSFNN